jgi:hypothetical protein
MPMRPRSGAFLLSNRSDASVDRCLQLMQAIAGNYFGVAVALPFVVELLAIIDRAVGRLEFAIRRRLRTKEVWPGHGGTRGRVLSGRVLAIFGRGTIGSVFNVIAAAERCQADDAGCRNCGGPFVVK